MGGVVAEKLLSTVASLLCRFCYSDTLTACCYTPKGCFLKKFYTMIYHLLAVLCVVLWGSTFISTKILIQAGFTPAQIFFLRFLLAYVGLIGIQLYKKERLLLFCENWKEEAQMLIAALTGGSVFFWLQNTAMVYAEASIVSFLVCVAPLLTAFLALWVGVKQKPTLSLWVGAVIALIGVYFIVTGIGEESTSGSNRILGGTLAFIAALLWSVYQLICQPLSQKYGTLLLTRKIFGYGVLTILPSFFFEERLPWEQLLEPSIIGHFSLLGIGASLGCFWAWNTVIQRIGSVISANYLYIPPLVASLLAFFILDEALTVFMLFGGALILLGVAIAIRPRKPHVVLQKVK